MGCKRWWRGGLELLLLCILHRATLGDGNIGCLYSEDLCEKGYEFCYNDLAFGKCTPLFDDLDEEDDYQYELNSDEIEFLREQLEVLEFEGYKWSHPYTQCVMQTIMLNIRYSLQNSVEECNYLRQENQRFQMTNNIEDEDNEMLPQESPPMAIVRFTPSKMDPHGEYADEIYYPPGYDANLDFYPDERQKRDYPVNFWNLDRPDSYDGISYYPDEDDGSEPRSYSTSFEAAYASDDPSDVIMQPDYAATLKQIVVNENNDETGSIATDKNGYEKDLDNLEYLLNGMFETMAKTDEVVDDNQEGKNGDSYKMVEDNLESLDRMLETLTKQEMDKEIDDAEEEDYEKKFSQKYKNPRFEFSNADESIQPKFDLPKIADRERVRDQVDLEKKSVNGSGAEQGGESQNMDFLVKSLKNAMPYWKELYTEGGLVKPNEDDDDDDDNDDVYDYDNDNENNNQRSEKDVNEQLINENGNNNFMVDDKDVDKYYTELLLRELAGFKRHERLDVKKPGPLFLTNNYGFKTEPPSGDTDEDSNVEDDELQQDNNGMIYPPVKKEPLNSGNFEPLYDNVDLNHVYIEIKGEFRTWIEGKHVVEEITKLLKLDSDILRDIRVGRAEVTFRVMKNNKNFNATDIVNKIDDIRPEIQQSLGVEIMRAGIGDKAKLPAAYEFTSNVKMSDNAFGAIVATGIVSAFVAAVVVLLLIRRHAKSRAKVAGLSTDPEASKDYQDLCRARMQVKQPTEKSELPRAFRLINRVNDSTNSSRSSTSSWGEEPAPTNLDISTGHMVLSYMEDHLKNQDKLDEEWAAVCAYEAEPCSTAIAEKPENAQYNRPGAVLPYDHSRVVLNDLTSVSNSDYINASTITDHDPRNPAYIATQGPLPQTAAHFWQLVWEQGSVVIIMLTRLTEEGKAMCHRYWPEEGAELYHIYEVHLVSEHIWCDDYLVRSFYLKNLRTGETRTVTQFHFLSWPEHGIPQSTKALLEFRRKVNKSYRGRSCPIVVHCSDGAGRTGTYCLIDMVLNRMTKGAKEIDIAATLEHIRDQRPGIVANKRQFEFVLVAVAEEVHAILKALPIPPAEKSPTPSVSDVPSTSKLVSFENQQSTSKSN